MINSSNFIPSSR